MADVNTDPVRCRCGKTWDRMALAQCPDDGSDLWEITTIAPPPPPPPPPPPESGGTPRTELDPVTASDAAIALTFDGATFRLEPDQPVALGRDESYPTAQVFRSHSNVSRFHAVLLCENGQVFVTDTGSVNGTYINDHRLDADIRYEIRPGQRLRLAADVHLLLRWDR